MTASTLLASEVPADRETGFYATATKTGAHYRVLGPTAAGVLVRSARVGALGRLVQTGRVVGSDGQVRARLDFAVDTGDVAGTLSFGPDYVLVKVPAVVF